ncbi:MAG: Rrf2 family transcriptional regulator [Pseudomonadota bacterium]|nr:Rrf2 family transcriptional regulator [Pseudomonadota bacterium]
MRLTTKGQYAVTAIVDLGKHIDGEPIALADVADRQGISLSYLEQLFQKLRRAALVKSVRGPGGGYLLSKESREMPISDVIAAVEEPIRATRCAPGTPRGCMGGVEKCLTHDLWDELIDQIHLFLNSVTLYDVVEGRIRRDNLSIGGAAV